MLSILIPTYNYNVFPLVSDLHKQCLECEIEFEILCQDDASNQFLEENLKINAIENCSFSRNDFNFGRGKNINSLAEKAKFEWLLIMDCDTFPTQNDFIKKYVATTNNPKFKVVFGGIEYEKEKPEKEKILRWAYGNKRESLSLKIRNEKPNSRALTSNLLIQKELFIKNPFDASITKYGYEDLCFMSILGINNIKVSHIDNPTFHLNLETSVIFLNKTKTALENLAFIVDSKIYDTLDSKIVSTHRLLQKCMLAKLMALFFKKSEAKIRTNLLSENPSLFLFNIYKLGYYCNLKK